MQSRSIYRSCSELPLFNFIKIVVRGEMEYLYSEPAHRNKSEVELSEVWETIFDEYNELSGNKSSDHILNLIKQVTVINGKLFVITSAVSILENSYSEAMIGVLRRHGFRYSYTPESMQRDLKLTLSSAKKLVIQRQEAERELGELNKSSDGEVKEEDFYKLLRQLSKFNGFHIDAKTTTVLEFLKDIELFNSENSSK